MHVADSLITGMTDLFRSPYGADKAQQTRALKEYYAALSGYTEDVLEETWRRLRIRHTKAGWPVPAEIILIANEIMGETPVKESGNFDAENALASPQGQYALENGTAHCFMSSCKTLGWIPDQELTERIVRQERFRCGNIQPHQLAFHQQRERGLREQHLKDAA